MSRRVQSVPAFFGVFLCAGAVVYGCSSTEEPFAPNTGTGQGGSTSTTGTGGGYPYATGGYRPATTPYVVPGGGASTVGTKTGTVPATLGGATGVSTVVGTGGVGTTTTTGVTATGGVVATTTAAVNPNTGKTVSFKAGKATGAMSGYAYVAMGAEDPVTSPTCGTAAITAATPCASGTTWAADTTLCITGSCPLNSPADYTKNWGFAIGINATDPASGVLNQAHSSVTFTFTVTPATTVLQGQVHLTGDAAGTNYCIDGVVSGTAIPLTSFAKNCYDKATAVPLPAAKIPNIDKIALQVSSSTTAAIPVTTYCISDITFQ